MKLSIIIPVFNEEKTIERLIEKVYLSSLSIGKEVIVIDDGSTDKTNEILKSLRNKHGFIFLSHKKNQGKGSAVRTGLAKATGEFVIIQDADLEYDPNDYENLIVPLLKGDADVVYGSRNLKKGQRGSLIFYFGGRAVTIFANILYGLSLTDEPTCYKVFKRDLLKNFNLESKGFEFCPEITAKLAKTEAKIIEIPISYNPRSWQDGKKINWKDAFLAFWTLLKYKLKD